MVTDLKKAVVWGWGIGGRAQELCESPGGRPGVPVPDSHYDLCGRKETFEEEGGGGVLKIVVDARASERERERALILNGLVCTRL